MVDVSGLGGNRPITEATLRTRLRQLGLISSSDVASSVATKEHVASATSFETAGISLSSAQPVNRITQTPVEFDTVDFEDGVTTDVVTDHDLTIVTPGLYLLTYFGYWALDDTNRRLAWITKNGSRILGEDKPAQSTSDTTVSSIVPLVANDTIGALVRHESSTTDPLDLTYAELRVVRLRATP